MASKFVPICPKCSSDDLEWRTYAFFKILPGDSKNYVEIALNEKPVSVDYEADGEVYCNGCEDYHGRPRGWDSWREEPQA